MKYTGAIDEAIFSLSVAAGETQSKITFGGYSTDEFATAPLEWANMDPYTTYWKLTMNEMSFDLGSDGSWST